MSRLRRLSVWLAAAALWLSAPAAAQQPPGDPQRGHYVLEATGGCSCHTDYKKKGAPLAGGRAIKTPFGTAYGSNITPDNKTGLGTWSEADFVRAMTQGVGLHGKELFPFFPYTSYTRMTAADLRDLWAYLRTVPPVQLPNREHDLTPPFNLRSGIKVWKALNFSPQPFRPDAARGETWNRGFYLVSVLGHCAECHTPRDMTGALKPHLAYAGSKDGPEGEAAPNLTPERETGLGEWSEADIVYFLQTGLRPDGDSAQGLMAELIENGYSKLTEADLKAIALYVRDLKPIRNQVLRKK